MQNLLIVLLGISVVGFIVFGSVISYSQPADDLTLSVREQITNYVKENVLPVVREKRSELDLGADEQKVDELRQVLKTRREEMLRLRSSNLELWKNGKNEYPKQDPERLEKMQEMRFEQQKIMHDVFSVVLAHEEAIKEHLDDLKVYADKWRNDIQEIVSEYRAENEELVGSNKARRGVDRPFRRFSGQGFEPPGPHGRTFSRSGFRKDFGHFLQPSAYVLLNPDNMEEMFEMQRFNKGRLFPNPTTGPINIRFEVSEKSQIQVTLFDNQGNKIETILNKSYNPGTYTISYDNRELTPGVYYYEVTIGEDVMRNRFVKK